MKVWFQNRRTKLKRDKTRQHEEQLEGAESVATCNILRMLQPQKPEVAVGGSTSLQAPPSVNTMQHAAVPPIGSYVPSSLPSHFPQPCMPAAIRPHVGAMNIPPMYPTPLSGFFHSWLSILKRTPKWLYAVCCETTELLKEEICSRCTPHYSQNV